ncbi:MAG: hypothetical protein LUG99_15035 [Lachnospiraceae bacterium]|nr:hypothetical protein [Lachnospiraceae bacterium]
MESKLVSTVSFCPVCCPSDTWMGNVSPVEKIRRSGMWQVNELYKEPLDTGDMDDLMANLVT